MKKTNLVNLGYQNNITKKKVDNTFFLIDEVAGALFSQSDTGIYTFQNEEGNKWLYTDLSINIDKDIPHFITPVKNGRSCIVGSFTVFDNKENLLQKAYNYFSQFIVKTTPRTELIKWSIFLN